jgi:MCP family monocarboxylic acid transporter-like MFS transporter 10
VRSGGLLGDRIGRLNTQCPSTILLGLSTLTLWMVAKSVHTLIIFAIIFGFLSGIYVAVLPPVVSQISPDENMGARMGAFYSIIAVASLTGAPIAGTLIRGNGKEKEDYTGVIGCAGGMLILGGIIFCVARWLHGGRTRWRW